MMLRKPVQNNEAGFTLIEALIAMVVLTIGVFALYAMQVTAIRGNATGNSISLASNFATDQIEKLISRPIKVDDDIDAGKKVGNAILKDVNGDGTNEDLNGDGIDDGGGNFGLDNVDAAADYTINPPNQNYTIFYNVAEDVPIKDVKLIQVIVRDNNTLMRNTVRYQYIKNSSI